MGGKLWSCPRATLSRELILRQEEETCSGLMWLGSRSIPWICRADTHVYNIRIGPLGWTPPHRESLVWMSIPLPPSAPEDFAHIQVRQDCADARVLMLEIDGIAYPVTRDPGDPD